MIFEFILIATYLWAKVWTVVNWRGVWRLVAVLPIPLILYGLIQSWRYGDNYEWVLLVFLLPMVGGLYLAISAGVKLLVAEAAAPSNPPGWRGELRSGDRYLSAHENSVAVRIPAC